MVDDAKERLYMKDLYCSYYTESDEITSYMISKLNIKDNDIILEPSAGEGIFIDGIINQQKNIQIDALDINEKAVNILKKKYLDMPNVRVRLTDTLLDRQLDMYADRQLWLKITDTLEDKELDYISDKGGYYDKIIGNPPYGAWQDYDKRKILKKKYKGQYVKETYTLFLYRCIFLLKKGGKLSFIIPDTFLFLNMHKSLREFLLKSTKIEEILIFPSNFFPGVNFGYSNLSIITLEKDDCESVKDNDVKIFTGFNTVRELGRIDENSENLQCFCYKQSDILKNENYKFIITDNSKIAIINDSKVRIGDVADVVTGFYSGNNKEFICAKSKEIKGAQNYRMVDCDKIYDCYDLTGIKNVAEGYVAYVKGSSDTRYIRKEDEWYVRWDKETVDFYIKDKKARFQNSKFYFKTGIAIPMVKSKQIKATLMRNRVFDQSIVGIFPKEKDKIYYMLALMNSNVINKLLHIINPTANNSANYIKQLPYREPGYEMLMKINSNVVKILDMNLETDIDKIEAVNEENNKIFDLLYQDIL